MEFSEFLKNSLGDKTYGYIETVTGISKSYLSKVVRGERGTPKPEILKKLSKVTTCSYEELMFAAGYIDKTSENTTKPNTITLIARNGGKTEYEVPEENMELIQQMLDKLSKK